VRIVFVSISIIFLIFFGAFHKKTESANNTGFTKNIKFNHLSVVIDDSTYKYLFDSLKFFEEFAKTSEQSVDAGSESWTGKYVRGKSNYLEIFRPGGAKGIKLGDLGIGLMTNKFGTIDSLQSYWTKTLDSVHVENMVITDSGKSTPWYTSVSIPNVDSLKITAWVMENAKEEMNYAGFSESELSGEIEFSEYSRRITAKLRNIPVDSVKYDKLFDKVTSLDISLSNKELAYLKGFLLDIGFTEKDSSFSKEDFRITYSVTNSEHFLLNEIVFSLLKRMPKGRYAFRKIVMIVDGDKAKMKFTYH
jgi:Family of unknown function (DUF5829)